MGRVVSDVKTFFCIEVIQKQECQWQPCLLSNQNEMLTFVKDLLNIISANVVPIGQPVSGED
jgi:hypothetical protein